MMKTILLMITLLFAVVTAAFADIDAVGEGGSKEQALVSAMRRAVEQGVGVALKSSTTVVDSALVEDKILSHSRGYITSYKVTQELKNVDGFTVTISAQVDIKILRDDLDSLSILRKNIGNPRILVAFSQKGEGAHLFRNRDFIDEIYNGIVESLTDRQFRVVDRSAAENFARQVADTHEINVYLNRAADYGLRYNAEYTLLYSVSGELMEFQDGKEVKLRIKTRLIDNSRALEITNKMVEQSSGGQTMANALEKAAREGGLSVVAPMIDVIKENWMDMLQNGALYTIVIDGVHDPEQIASFTGMLEKFPLVRDAREVESGGGKTTFEATFKGKRDQLDRDVLRASRELGWTVKKVRAEGARSTWLKM